LCLSGPPQGLEHVIGCLASGIDDAETLGSAHRDLAPMKQTAIWFVSVDRMLGRPALALQKSDAAVTHFEDGPEFCRNAGYLPELAWTCSTMPRCCWTAMMLRAPQDAKVTVIRPSTYRTRRWPSRASLGCARSPSTSWRCGRFCGLRRRRRTVTDTGSFMTACSLGNCQS